ncbi:TorF family putative porin [Pleionea sediminis]|uniref:TorF family putative porin n=1 Tax=Pleionea sediminis TaxID=2569479 RepID=UPI0013DDD24C|nr:TorF family putative porin [Pleionea sediminis]
MNKLLSASLGSALIVVSPWAISEPFDLSVGVASEYVYRGLSESGEDPAVNAAFEFRPQKGWFVRGFVSEVESRAGGNLEVEFAGGYRGRINKDFTYEGEVVYSIFTDEEGGDSDYAEVNASLTYKDFITLLFGHTNDYFGLDEAGTYVEGRFNLPLHDVIKTAAYVGHYSLDGLLESYSVFGFDAWTNIGEIEMKLSFSDTDLDNFDNGDSRIFVNASYQF